MTIDIAYCDDEATKTILAVAPGGTMPPQRDHVHDDGSTHTVTVLANAVGDFDPEAYADSDAYVTAIAIPLIPAPSGAISDQEHVVVDCQTHAYRCYIEPVNGTAAVCPIASGDTLNTANTKRRTQIYRDGESNLSTQTGKVRHHIDWDDEVHTKSFHEIKS